MQPYWTSEIPVEREAAMHACRTVCPVQPQCAAWSLCLPLNDPSVYAGLSQMERRRRRKRFMDGLPWPGTGRLP
jgi:Transcription factor WhiB